MQKIFKDFSKENEQIQKNIGIFTNYNSVQDVLDQNIKLHRKTYQLLEQQIDKITSQEPELETKNSENDFQHRIKIHNQYYYKGIICYHLQKYEESDQYLDHCLILRPYFPVQYLYKALILLQQYKSMEHQFGPEQQYLRDQIYQLFNQFIQLKCKDKKIIFIFAFALGQVQWFENFRIAIYDNYVDEETKKQKNYEDNLGYYNNFLDYLELADYYQRVTPKDEIFDAIRIIDDLIKLKEKSIENPLEFDKNDVIFNIPLDRIMYVRCHFYDRVDNIEECISEALKIQKLNPNHVKAQFIIGINYGKQGEYQKAIDHQLKILKKYPNFLNVYINLGYLYNFMAEEGTEIKQAEIYKQCFKKFPFCSQAYFNSGNLEWRKHRYTEALQLHETAIKNFPSAYLHLAVKSTIIGSLLLKNQQIGYKFLKLTMEITDYDEEKILKQMENYKQALNQIQLVEIKLKMINCCNIVQSKRNSQTRFCYQLQTIKNSVYAKKYYRKEIIDETLQYLMIESNPNKLYKSKVDQKEPMQQQLGGDSDSYSDYEENDLEEQDE